MMRRLSSPRGSSNVDEVRVIENNDIRECRRVEVIKNCNVGVFVVDDAGTRDVHDL